MSAVAVQHRVVVARKDERVEGPDDAALVVTTPLADAQDEDFDDTPSYMGGRLGSTA